MLKLTVECVACRKRHTLTDAELQEAISSKLPPACADCGNPTFAVKARLTDATENKDS